MKDGHCSTNIVRDTRHGLEPFYNLSEYGELTEQQKRILSPPSIGNRPNVVADE